MASRYARPSDLIPDLVVPTLTAGAADPAFHVTNLANRNAHSVFKSTGNFATVTWAYGVSKVLEGFSIHNHNLAGATVTVTNNNGFSQVVTIPANSIDPWINLAGVPGATTWNLVVTGAATVVGIGLALPMTSLRTWHFQRDYPETEKHFTVTHWTDYGVKLTFELGVRQRGKRGRILLATETDRADVLALYRDCRGGSRPFFFIPDDRYNDALFVTFLNDPLELSRMAPGASSVELNLLEEQKGLSL